MEENKISILIVGASGKLGNLILKHCIKQNNLQVNILIRNKIKAKTQIEEVESIGGRVIIADLLKPETLKDCCLNIHTVISCVIGNDDIVIDGQIALIEEAIKCDVKRFVASDYSYDYTDIPEGIHFLTDQRKKIRKFLDRKKDIKALHFFNGVFMESYIFGMNSMGGEIFYWGDDPNQKIDMTTYEDTAKYVARVVSDKNRFGEIKVAGDQQSSNELSEIYSKVIGMKCEPKRLGSLEEIKKRIQNARDKIFTMQNRPEINDFSEITKNPILFDAFILPYQLFMYDGTAKLKNIDNDEFSEVKPMKFEEFLISYPYFRLNGYN